MLFLSRIPKEHKLVGENRINSDYKACFNHTRNNCFSIKDLTIRVASTKIMNFLGILKNVKGLRVFCYKGLTPYVLEEICPPVLHIFFIIRENVYCNSHFPNI